MTNKEKAIKALDCEYQCYGVGSTLENILIHEGDDAIIEIKAINLFNAIKYLKEPSLDDCIAVVESMKNSLPTLTSREKINVYKRVLTALKGLKEGNNRAT